ncbi:MAG: hypothetical protein HY360_14510 [Verrucomicrobia bacterium]|nr:hypothetical protein [Verrucomicrobiota bacterium]
MGLSLKRQRQQLLSAREPPEVKRPEMARGEQGILAEELKAAIVLFVRLLDE